MAEKVDARGLECPHPVILTKKALEAGALELQVLVNNKVACDNISRLGKKMGCIVKTRMEGEDFVVGLTKSEKSEAPKEKRAKHSSLIFVNSDMIGKGSDELGEALLKAFLNTLAASDNKPDKLVFMNSGVRMVAQDSGALDSLKNLENQGVEVLACGTCLDYFSLKDQIAAGRISNMYDILDSMLTADKVITI